VAGTAVAVPLVMPSSEFQTGWFDRWGALVLGVLVPIALAIGVTAYLLP
jgi:hypothetical protein